MLFTDKFLVCIDCGADFVFTADEQQRYAQLGFHNEPGRCPACRTATRAAEGRPATIPRSRRGLAHIGTRELFHAVCSVCARDAQIPFRPRGDRPVYCADCFGRRR